MKKGGLSPVVASVLLVALVLVLAAIVFLWARGFISEQIEKFGQPIDEYCSQIVIEAQLIDGPSGPKSELEIANRGSVDIKQFEIKEFTGGDSIVSRFDFSINKGGAVKEPVSFTNNLEDIDKIIIYPALLGNVRNRNSNKIYTCLEQGRTINF